MNNVDKQYFELINHILENGVTKSDRTGTGTISVFDYTMKFDMSEGFPLLTSKKMFTKGIKTELIWFLNGETNIKYLVDNGCNIWNGDAYKMYMKSKYHKGPITNMSKLYDKYGEVDIKQFAELIKTDEEFSSIAGELGPVYGAQWRRWSNPIVCEPEGWYDEPIDQITELINELRTNPDSRRLIVTAWNICDLPRMTLPPCHFVFQCYTQEMTFHERVKYWCNSLNKNISYAEDLTDRKLDSLNVPKRKLSLKWTQRSCDVPLGIPYNIASYGFLLHLLAKEVNMVPDQLIFSGGDCHIYLNQVDGIKEQIMNKTFKLPTVKLNNKSIFNLEIEDMEILDYESDRTIKLPLSN